MDVVVNDDGWMGNGNGVYEIMALWDMMRIDGLREFMNDDHFFSSMH